MRCSIFIFMSVGALLAAISFSGCSPQQCSDHVDRWHATRAELVESHGEPIVALTYVGGLPLPGAPSLRVSHPRRVLHSMIFPDGFVCCESADGSTSERHVAPSAVEELRRELLAEGADGFGLQFAVDSSAYVLHIAGPKQIDAAWATGWIDADFASKDERVVKARRWHQRIGELACRVGAP